MNPYLAYILSFLTAMILYSLGWSTLYPALSLGLAVFLLITIVAHAAVAMRWKASLNLYPRVVLPEDSRPLFVTGFIFVLWVADFIYAGGIPLIKILLHQPYDYRRFGIPSLHVFTVTFASFYTVYLFQLFLDTKKKIVLALFCLNLLAAILIYSRAMFVFNLTTCAFIYLHHLGTLRARYVAIGGVALAIVLYFFGVLGNIRETHEHEVADGNAFFLETGRASESFRNSSVPNEYFWTYAYLTSPLANLQKNIIRADKHPVSLDRLGGMMASEWIFDFISKRLFRAGWMIDPGEHTIHPFNVSTVYSRSYSYQGWFGMTATALFILIVPWVYRRILGPSSPYLLIGLGTLCTMYLFMMYDNTLRSTGLAFQIVYPFCFTWLEKSNWLHLRKT